MRMGSCRATSVTKSNSSCRNASTMTERARSRMASVYRSTVLRVKPRFTRRRRRVWSGGSSSIIVRRASVSSASISSRRIPRRDVKVSQAWFARMTS